MLPSSLGLKSKQGRGLTWSKWRWGTFSPSTSVSPASLHSTNCSTITLIYRLGLVHRPEVAAAPRDLVPPLKKNREARSKQRKWLTKMWEYVETKGTFNPEHGLALCFLCCCCYYSYCWVSVYKFIFNFPAPWSHFLYLFLQFPTVHPCDLQFSMKLILSCLVYGHFILIQYNF
jgi:hypothetical protein